MQPIEGINADRVTQWFDANVPGVQPPLAFDLIAGGRSNLTFKVSDQAGHTWALRRPPVSHVLPTAHDMGREYRIISALQDTPVPVAESVGYTEDESVNDRPFYVMGYVEGHVLRDAATAEKVLDEAGRRRAGEHLVDVLADIHAVDVDAVGLGELGRREGYIERQLKRWYGQFQQSAALQDRTVPVVDEMHDFLAARIPAQGPATIVHGDYRLDNTMLGDDGSVLAVLDWEICTLGDPLADVGLLMVYWAEPGDEYSALGSAPTVTPGFPTREELKARYAARSGRDLSSIDFYISFGYWKLACILEGVYSRYAAGAGGGDQSGFEFFAEQVQLLADASKQAADRL
ncbi:MAG TPA: phosphotransferase family protein [Acidimicrobiales bacterium]|nr:phosphotransferase family protein [Acidimicrobiales bacterium]